MSDTLRPDWFLAPSPGRVRIERAGSHWHVSLDRPDHPLDLPVIEVLVESNGNRLAVTRNIAMRAGGSMSEIVGTIPLNQAMDGDAVGRILQRTIGFALTGTSRLPITSVQTPHPLFSLGWLAYLPQPPRSTLDHARDLEAKLRSRLSIAALPSDFGDVARTLFHHLALSPYTSLVDDLVPLILRLDRGPALDLLGYMLRHLARHLNAFDLVKFHNMGANYPDALMLDALLRAYVDLLDENAMPMHRRALRQGWMARKRCEGLLVPDHPTSVGDNTRDLPHPAVPQAQLTEPASRTRRLFAGEPAEAMLSPIARRLLAQSIDDLSRPEEVQELGTAVFLDRPIGAIGKRAAEVDGTTLISSEACSARLIASRLEELRNLGLITSQTIPSIAPPTGCPVSRLPGHARQGVVSLEDAKKVALDFVFTRSTRSSLNDLLRAYDFSALNATAPGAYQLLEAGRVLLIRTDRTQVTVLDAQMKPVLRLAFEQSAHYVECGGIEYAEGLCAIIQEESVEQSVPLPPRWDG